MQTRAQKITLLKAIQNGEKISQAIKEDIGPVIIKISNDEYWCPTISKTLTASTLEAELSTQQIREKTKVVFIIPDNNR